MQCALARAPPLFHTRPNEAPRHRPAGRGRAGGWEWGVKSTVWRESGTERDAADPRSGSRQLPHIFHSFRQVRQRFLHLIDQDALDFVKGNPEVAGGVRRGKKIYQTKIPYMIIEYLKEKDPKLKRYYGCHCLLARESILSGEEMSRNLCYCSAGYEKMPYEVAFGKPVKTEVLKSILWGDTVCRFAMEIPEGYLPKRK